MEHFDNYIDGKWTKSNSKKTFKNISPSNIKECLGVFPMSNKIDIDNAVTAAKKAFEQWKATPAPVRGKIIFKIGQIMSKRKKELANIISKENGKTIAGGLGDVQSGIDMAYFVGGEGRRWYGRTTHSNLPKRFAMTKRFPVGIVGIIPSWNTPMALICWKTLPALLCGNTIILKSEENTPETAVRFAEILEEAGVPKGVLNLIHGIGSETGDLIVNHPDISMISFTGSSTVGKIIATNCAKRLAKTSLELGGKNAIIVMDMEMNESDAVIVAGRHVAVKRVTRVLPVDDFGHAFHGIQDLFSGTDAVVQPVTDVLTRNAQRGAVFH